MKQTIKVARRAVQSLIASLTMRRKKMPHNNRCKWPLLRPKIRNRWEWELRVAVYSQLMKTMMMLDLVSLEETTKKVLLEGFNQMLDQRHLRLQGSWMKKMKMKNSFLLRKIQQHHHLSLRSVVNQDFPSHLLQWQNLICHLHQ